VTSESEMIGRTAHNNDKLATRQRQQQANVVMIPCEPRCSKSSFLLNSRLKAFVRLFWQLVSRPAPRFPAFRLTCGRERAYPGCWGGWGVLSCLALYTPGAGQRRKSSPVVALSTLATNRTRTPGPTANRQ
jgi:hypothetical protein